MGGSYEQKLLARVVLIVGGTSGIGFAVAQASISEGAHVIIVSSQPEKVTSAIGRLKNLCPSGSVTGRTCDLSDADDLEDKLEQLFQSIEGPLDHIIFTAATTPAMVPVSGLNVNIIRQASSLSFMAPLLVAKVGAKHLRPGHESSITLTGGSVGERPQGNWVLPAAYAAAIPGMARGLALELKPTRVNVVSPGATMTEIWNPMPAEIRQGTWQAIAQGHTTGKMGRPQDVAEAYVYLMKDWNSSGSVVHSNGGVLLM
ncbi:hypothetical protein BKA67DRAFT_676049 [Truncatella angustata]|uniref:Ketoreductase domain-containing protein n=1 Tax=Truncatella angustata TaxID=152316 RepID=A0A9P8UQ41_9PEZI|nr:uncharacterized protein BKA67DRAFT_676049 [Truncatella angustata]KAH6655999.1 hypothetical protein BKA67DRAFT_676049 [Truncatella angustata]KAH8200990.1 hypothetical protein TruAng_004849 [Truncatella angustata]